MLFLGTDKNEYETDNNSKYYLFFKSFKPSIAFKMVYKPKTADYRRNLKKIYEPTIGELTIMKTTLGKLKIKQGMEIKVVVLIKVLWECLKN